MEKKRTTWRIVKESFIMQKKKEKKKDGYSSSKSSREIAKLIVVMKQFPKLKN